MDWIQPDQDMLDHEFKATEIAFKRILADGLQELNERHNCDIEILYVKHGRRLLGVIERRKDTYNKAVILGLLNLRGNQLMECTPGVQKESQR